MADVKWIKITSDIFDDDKILLIESMPDKDAIIVIWFKLLCLAGKQNNSGVFIMNDRIPYTEEMLAAIFRRPINTVRMALKVFEEYGMIEIIDGVITIPNWGKHQTMDKIEAKNEYMKNYMREYREKQKKKIECKSKCKTNSKANVSEAEEEIDIEEELDKEKEKDINVSTNVDTSVESGELVDALNVMDAWNQMAFRNGLSQVTKMSDTRKRNLIARIKEYSFDEVIRCINTFDDSPLLIGKKTDWKADFDWFIKKANFLKVHEGNYINQGGTKKGRLDWIDNIDFSDVTE